MRNFFVSLQPNYINNKVKMTERRVRVRFAPSPTGALHIGGVRTALYNYLFARQHGGDLVFRIEDTDSNRFVPGAEQYIIESLRWCGIYPDEGVDAEGRVVETPSERHPHAPYRQSQRRGIYRQYAEQLVSSGHAYYAFDTEQMRNSLTLPKEEVDRLIAEGHQYVVRFRVEPNQEILVNDLIRGEVRVKSDICDDKVLYKSADELPTYHLANIVDECSAARHALPGFWLAGHHAAVCPPAAAAEARRQG